MPDQTPYDPFERPESSRPGAADGPVDPVDPVDPAASDPLERLRSLRTSGPAMPAMSPQHVRRLGDRRRRRRNVGLLAASVAVIAVFAGGGVALTNVLADPDAAPDPASPSERVDSVRTDVPADFPLEAGWPTGVLDGLEERDLDATSLDVCGASVSLEGADGLEGTRALIAGGEGESSAYNRSIAAFDSVGDAEAYVAQVRDLASSCEEFEGDGGTTLIADSIDVDLESFGTDMQAPPQEGVTVEIHGWDVPIAYRLFRVENAVMISTTAGYSAEVATDEPGILVEEGLALDQPAVTAMQYYAGFEVPSWSPADDETEGTEPPPTTESDNPSVTVEDTQFITADDIPVAERLEPWREVESGTEPTIMCESEPLSSLGALVAGYAEFTADFVTGGTPPGQRDGAVNTGILGFATPQEADAAYATASDWVSSCSAPIDGEDVSEHPTEVDLTLPEGTEGYWYGWAHSEPDYCGDFDCDAARFDYQGVALVGNYVLLVSYSEIGGPLSPDGMDERMNELFTTAVTRLADNS